MARPVTLFTGQWADLPLEELAARPASGATTASSCACWGDHFDVDRALADDGYCDGAARAARAPRAAVLGDLDAPRRPGGLRPDRRAAPGDPPARRLGRRRPEGVSRRAAEEMKDTARAAAASASTQVNGFTGSRDLAPALLVPAERLRRDRARLRASSPSAGIRSSTSSTRRACASAWRCTRPRSPSTSSRRGGPSTPSSNREGSASTSTRATSLCQIVDSAAFVAEFADRIYHVHVKDVERRLDGRTSDPRLAPELRRPAPRLGLPLAGPRRRRLRATLRALNRIGYDGPALGRVGGPRHGPRVRRPGRARVRPAQRLRPVAGRLRRGDAGRASERAGRLRDHGRRAGRRSGRSASGCSATPSWARRTRTRTGSRPT